MLKVSLCENYNILDLDDARLLGIEIVLKHCDDEIKLLFANVMMMMMMIGVLRPLLCTR
jgi:hypothetical protein